MKLIYKHKAYYLSLSVIFIMGLALMLVAKHNPQLRMMAILMMAFFYVLWGIVHHILDHDMSVRIVIEYVLLGALGIVLALLTIH